MKKSNLKKKICILTATRAEYGLLKPVINKMLHNADLEVFIAVTGMHLSRDFGSTYKEIENDGLAIDKKIPILDGDDSPKAISKAMGMALIEFGKYFEVLKPDMIVVLGDRYETLAVSCAAMNQGIPIAHLYGGERTEGAIDEAIRHAITKLSYLHFTSTEVYRHRVIQLGEEPKRVFNVGALGIENILKETLFTKNELSKELQVDIHKPYVLVTFHPVTLEKATAEEQMKNLLSACAERCDVNYIFTKANADAGGLVINELIDSFTSKHDNAFAFASLGVQKYLSAIKYCSAVMGNSSSGIVEVPSFGKPTINIGDRQKGRIQSESVINCDPDVESIIKALHLALSNKISKKAKAVKNPYAGIDTSKKIVEKICDALKNGIELKKRFYDVDFED